jgi:hypothetical protein
VLELARKIHGIDELRRGRLVLVGVVGAWVYRDRRLGVLLRSLILVLQRVVVVKMTMATGQKLDERRRTMTRKMLKLSQMNERRVGC